MLRGARTAVVRRAIRTGDPFPGTSGFAGKLGNGRLVRDVLGRVPLYIERKASGSPDGDWAFEPDSLSEPAPFPPGTVGDSESVEQVWELAESGTLDGFDRLDRSNVPEELDRAMATAVEAIRSARGGPAVTSERGDETGQSPQTALAFSGGVDSTLLAARFDVPLYTVGFPDSHDVRVARETAARFERPLRVVELDHDKLAALVPTVAGAIGRTNAMDVQIAIPLYCVAESVRADGYDRLIVGQGADELFGGYEKVEAAPTDSRVAATSVLGARNEILRTLPDQIERDVPAISAAGVTPVSPFLHDAVVRTALRLPAAELVDSGTRKVALRRLAAMSLPDSVADRPKKAMQYGTNVSRELDRLARQAGFKRRMDDHVGQYIAARVDAGDSTDPA